MQTADGVSFVLHFPKSEPNEFRNNTAAGVAQPSVVSYFRFTTFGASVLELESEDVFQNVLSVVLVL